MSLMFGLTIDLWVATAAVQPSDVPPPPAGDEASVEEPSPDTAEEAVPADEPVADEPVADEPPSDPASIEPVETAEPTAPAEASDAPAEASSSGSGDPFVAVSTSSAHDDEQAPSRESSEDDEEPEFDRRGLTIVGGAGITHCAQDLCTPIRMGGAGRFELGYRLGRVAFFGTIVGGGGKHSRAEETNVSEIRTFDAGAGLAFFPVRTGRIDPYVGATLGFARMTRIFDEDSSNEQQYTKRAAARFSGGIAWYVSRRVAMGPRVDVQVPFRGEWCTKIRDVDEAECASIRDDILEDIEDEFDKRQTRRAFPKMWAVTFDVRINL